MAGRPTIKYRVLVSVFLRVAAVFFPKRVKPGGGKIY
jgi:hypothetical protein